MEQLSNCCGANAIGEVINSEGRCANCCEMAAIVTIIEPEYYQTNYEVLVSVGK